MPNRIVYKSAITGEIVSKEYATANPDTTYGMSVDSSKEKEKEDEYKEINSDSIDARPDH